jgi:hypothetical protein
MKWQTALVGAVASAAVVVVAAVATLTLTVAAHADVRVTSDPGGEVLSYVNKYREMRRSGEHLVIDGPCLSACTLFTAFIPPNQVCVTRRAVLGFHAASYYDDARRSFVPTRAGTRLVMHMYPAAIRHWIEQRGGLTPRIMKMQGNDLASLYRTCD